ncbi:MAG: translation initiation factor IF-3 [bacterium]|nr:translation initiation factor IF-3 [bacterium]
MAKALRRNDQIRISPIRLIDAENEQRGVVSNEDAQRMAREAGLDLVEVAPLERPPVCRIMDYGKFLYDQKKKTKARTGHDVHIKEVRLRPKTDDNDRLIKMNRALKFLGEGHKVQFTMLFRGRERAHREVGLRVFDAILNELGDKVKVERPARNEGARMIMLLSPIKR